MGSIQKIQNENGKISYKVKIRKKNVDIYKTFYDEEDAKLYIEFKERLIQNIDNFEIPLSSRITLEQVFELKKTAENFKNKKSENHLLNSFERLSNILGANSFVQQLSFDDWLNCAKLLYSTDVYRGAKNENGKRKMSPRTLRNILAYASSAIEYAKSQGIVIENYALKVIQTYVTPLIKNQ